ncbi:hypothetical protein [Corynebacterium urealyticum]|nr:hypothetical protein [Corynebacterium urealyticum]
MNIAQHLDADRRAGLPRGLRDGERSMRCPMNSASGFVATSSRRAIWAAR